VPFGRELWIEGEDFREVAPPKFFRLSPGTEVRLRGASGSIQLKTPGMDTVQIEIHR
jgi:hypothetical protein